MSTENAWWRRRMVALDLETTSQLPEEARVVTATVALVGGGEPTDAREWLADPGVEIPSEAAEIHGITTERARAEGLPVDAVVQDVVDTVRMACRAGAADGEAPALVIFNAPYDLTVLDREARRYGVQALPLADPEFPIHVVDPLLLDRWLWPYRKGSRKLHAICEVRGATLDGAHDSTHDAVAAARAAWAICAKGDPVLNLKYPSDHDRLRSMQWEWEQVRHDLARLHHAQARWYAADMMRLAEHFASSGKHEDAARVTTEWPVIAYRVRAEETAQQQSLLGTTAIPGG